MAIRLEHQPIGIAGLAAYAAGSGRRKERDRKYVTDLLQNQQARFDKYNLLANQQQFVVERDRERAGVEVAADMRRAGFRIGEMNLANMQAKERDESRFKKIKDADQLDFARGEFRDRRDYARSVLAKLPPIPEHTPVDVRKNLEKSRIAISQMATSQFDLGDPDVGAAFDEAVRSYDAGLRSIPKPSRAGEFNKDTAYLDPSGTAYDEPGPGRTPFSVSTGKPRFEAAETVPFRGQQVPVKTYQDHVKGIGDSQKQWDKGFQNAVTPEEQKAFEGRVGPRPESPPSVMDLRYPPPTAAQAAALDGVFGDTQSLPPPPAAQATAPVQQQSAQPPPPAAQTSIPRPMSQQDFEQLPPGTIFIAPDGSTRRK